MVVLAPLSSLTLRLQGYAVGPGRGETRRRATACRPIAGGLACPRDHASSVLSAGSRGILRPRKYRLLSYGRVPYYGRDAQYSYVAGRDCAWVGCAVGVLPEVMLSAFG